ncbi:hypothetical protein COV42_01360 [Candidatus Campbellbacteria bacterium CG11_big_fil_rev_8_21_14_0_20_44_21]|uniref:CopG family transcriptional regulator n=1 Tax=Candidatus Campbellbacteria bacterium CG22_combo_CG10-13_8_21_14_all_43_18 TaxID=1974530 RepID=A0A2H0DVS9_9BACT|nr:MAG: hypothetical protein COW82_03000 [Candidatus Campbellbacteria bacterium CG22_combo_CG10-13_8_21_14_all_43_18]PIR24307.1 MAG: hypothetical protein COV42_01360 [Candidatus Campbellbacteria bacterium CG11_big_fil_rev_8_21_14_0_20_44_21]
MNNKTLITILIVVAVGIVGFIAYQTFSNDKARTESSEGKNIVATVYKSPTCGCCGVYASYIKKEGYDVDTKNIRDMSSIKQEFGVPYELGSCHTLEIGGYVVEGHIPELAIQKLLAEKPDIKGISMPGMPFGSPGMPGPKDGDFVIYEITHEGAKGDVFMTI